MKKLPFIILIFLFISCITTLHFKSFCLDDSDKRLNVTTIVQHQEPWRDQQYGFGNRTIEYAGCALTTLAMLLRFNNVDTNPQDLNNWFKANNGYSGTENIRWEKASEYSKGNLSFSKIINFKNNPDLNIIKNEINKGNPVIAKVTYEKSYHYVLICGYNKNTFYINDPWTDDSSKTINEGFKPYGQPEKSIQGLVLYNSKNANKEFVKVVKVGVSKFSTPIVNDFLETVPMPEIKLMINSSNFFINDFEKEIDEGRGTKPVLLKGRTFLPVRAIFEALGGTVSWNDATKKIEVEISERTLEMWIDKRQAYINGYPFILDESPIEINGRTLVPIRPLIEKLGGIITWDESTETVTIHKNS